MQLFNLNALGENPQLDSDVAVCIGNFDGLHLGHQALIERCRIIADKLGIRSAVLTFSPHPEEFFLRHGKSEELLFTLEQKVRAMDEVSIDYLFIQAFHERLAQLSPRQFIEDYLQRGLRAKAIIVGDNFRFGYQRAGDSAYLKEFCHQQGLVADTVTAEHFNGQVISSTRIRKSLLHNGNVAEVRAMLGRPYLVEGVVTRGDQLGRKLGFPTANLIHIDQLIPANGVYAGWAWIPSRQKSQPHKIMRSSDALNLAVINIGHRPTVTLDQPELRVEAHIIDEDLHPDELYSQKIYLYLCQRLRGEMRFGSLEELKVEIQNNVDQTKNLKSQISF